MTYTIDRMKDIFAAADDIIAERPQLLEKKTDDIFNILDDGTGNMTVTRWAVMTRALMRGLTSYAIDDIISFLADISDNSLICEFTGYVLQNEKDIDMLDLLMTAYAEGRAEKVLPFVIPCVSSENECHAVEYITMVRLLNDIKNVGDRSRLVCEYAALIEKHCQEDVILSGYTEEYCSNTEMQQLVWQLGCALYKNRHDDAIKWTDMYVYSDDRSRQLMGADFIYRGLMYNTEYFEHNFQYIDDIVVKDEEMWEKLIPAYTQYLLYDKAQCRPEIRSCVNIRIVSLKAAGTAKRLICLEQLNYRAESSAECMEIMRNLIFDRTLDPATDAGYAEDEEKRLLNCADYYMSELAQEAAVTAGNCVYDLYAGCRYTAPYEFIRNIPRTRHGLADKQKEFVAVWYERFMYGTDTDFLLSADLFTHLVRIDSLVEYISDVRPDKQTISSLMQGLVLYAVDVHKGIIRLAIKLAEYIADTDYWTKFCIDNIYCDYPDTLTGEAQKQLVNDNVYIAELADRITAYDKEYREKVNICSNDGDFAADNERQRAYWIAWRERQSEWNKESQKQSFAFAMFPGRSMKYGRRIGYIQSMGNDITYHVSSYAELNYSSELPRRYIEIPVEYMYMREDYMRHRRARGTDNEAYS